MKTSIHKILIPATIIAVSILLSVNGFSQDRRLPDGTIVYGDGTRQLPNGTVIYRRGTARQRDRAVRLPDVRIFWPVEIRRYPDDRRYDRRNNGRWNGYNRGRDRRWHDNDDEHEGEHRYRGYRGRGEEDDD